MPLQLGAAAIDKMHLGGTEIVRAYLGEVLVFDSRLTPVNTTGTLTVDAAAGGRRNAGATITVTVADTDGIRAVVSMQVTASDGRTNTFSLSRVDADTFRGDATYNAARWRNGSVTAVYTDAADGLDKSLTQAYAVP
ncbi:MAG: hypothetical protein OXC29_23125 [Rhodococcus sp.]|nr:hypothetical protein [Rhodococcus sp. (in: high G+C Gram-positive bacteria)]